MALGPYFCVHIVSSFLLCSPRSPAASITSFSDSSIPRKGHKSLHCVNFLAISAMCVASATCSSSNTQLIPSLLMHSSSDGRKGKRTGSTGEMVEEVAELLVYV